MACRLWEPFVYEKDVIWEIPQFFPKLIFNSVKSPEFRFANATCFLEMYTNTYNDDKVDDDIEICLETSEPSIRHRIHVKCHVVTSEETEYRSQSREVFLPAASFLSRLCYTLDSSKLTDQMSLLLPNGALTLCFEMRVVKDKATPEAPSHPQESRSELPPTELHDASSQTEVLVTQAGVEEASNSVQKLQVDYNKLLKSEEDSDVCLKVSEKEFRAHRCILRARSTVFSAMFKHETKEKASGEVVIEDLDPETFPDFLQHVYAGRVENLSSKNVSSLYSAADKYDLQELKSECRAYMKRTLSVGTFCDVVTLALKHREDELLKLAVEFFCENLAKIIVTVKWQKFTKEHNTESNELLIKAIVPAAQESS